MLLAQRILSSAFCCLIIGVHALFVLYYSRSMGAAKNGLSGLIEQPSFMPFLVFTAASVCIAILALIKPNYLIVYPAFYLLFSLYTALEQVVRDSFEIPSLIGIVINILIPYMLWRWRTYLLQREPIVSPVKEF